MRRTIWAAVGLAVVILLAITQGPQVWHMITGNRSEAESTGVSDARFNDVVHFRDSNGLFDLPEAGEVEQTIDTQVEASYLASRILGLRFPSAITTNGIDKLAAFATDSSNPDVLRLEAFATLRAANDNRWKKGQSLAEQQANSQPPTVTANGIPDYLAIMEPANLVDPNVYKSTLASFDPGTNQTEQRSAASAIALSYLFANTDQVNGMFPALQTQMVIWLTSPDVTLPQFIISVGALTDSSTHQLSSRQLASIQSRVHGLQGCDGASTLLSTDGKRSSTCSLTLTALATEATPQ